MNQPGGHHAHHQQHEPAVGKAGAVVVQASGSSHADHAGGHDHGAMIADYRRRFPMAAGITFGTGFLMTPAVAAALMSVSTIIVAFNAQLLRFYKGRR